MHVPLPSTRRSTTAKRRSATRSCCCTCPTTAATTCGTPTCCTPSGGAPTTSERCRCVYAQGLCTWGALRCGAWGPVHSRGYTGAAYQGECRRMFVRVCTPTPPTDRWVGAASWGSAEVQYKGLLRSTTLLNFSPPTRLPVPWDRHDPSSRWAAQPPLRCMLAPEAGMKLRCHQTHLTKETQQAQAPPPLHHTGHLRCQSRHPCQWLA